MSDATGWKHSLRIHCGNLITCFGWAEEGHRMFSQCSPLRLRKFITSITRILLARCALVFCVLVVVCIPTPGIGLNSFYGPWFERIDLGFGRSFKITESKELEFQAQAFNLLNHANYYVQNGNGVNQLQYNPIGTSSTGQYPCGDGISPNQTCFLVPNSGPGNFCTLQEISPNGLPRVLQFSVRFMF